MQDIFFSWVMVLVVMFLLAAQGSCGGMKYEWTYDGHAHVLALGNRR